MSKKDTEMARLLVLQKKDRTCFLVPTIMKTEEGGVKREREI